MLDWLRGGKEQNHHGDQTYIGSINAFRQYVSNTIITVEGFANDLSPEYSEEALATISAHFEGISKEYTDFTIIANNSFYEVIQRSRSRLIAVKKVAQKAKNLAQLFEKYSKKPKSYSAVNGRLEINKLAGELKNLEIY